MKPIKLQTYLFTGCLMLTSMQGQEQSTALKQIQGTQIEVKDELLVLVERIMPLYKDLESLDAPPQDLARVSGLLNNLNQLSGEEIATILAALEQAAASTENTDESLQSVSRQQQHVLETLHKIFEEMNLRQLELELANKAETLQKRQSENLHNTKMAQEGKGDKVAAEAEQRAIEKEVENLTRELKAMEANQDPTRQAAIDELNALAEEATENLQEDNLNEALNAQEKLAEALADLASDTGLEQTPQDAAENLVMQLRVILQKQSALATGTVPSQAQTAQQEQIAADTQAMIIPVENISAPAGFQVSAATDAMRAAYRKLSSSPAQTAKSEQSSAIEHLEKAIELLEDLAEEADTQGEENGEANQEAQMQELANLFHRIEDLEQAQENVNNGGGSPSEQPRLTQQAAELQEDVLPESSETARHLGRAAGRMADSLDENLPPEERERLRAEAAEELGKAKAAMLNEGRSRREQPPGMGTGEIADIGEVDFENDVLGPEALSPADRDAIDAARRQPVSPEYAPMVEGYYEKISRMSE